MGMDVYGEKPLTKDGEYFRNNAWYWRPLWNYVCEVCPFISEEEHEGGHYNDGMLIDGTRAIRIAEKLDALLASGDVDIEEVRHYQRTDAMPDEVCKWCHGTGKCTDMEIEDGCNSCHGKGTVRPYDTWYHFKAENVHEFAQFCRVSGGFTIH